MNGRPGNYVALCGGIGGAKLAFGLSKALSPENLTVIVNTGDDFTHLGLHVSPDIDTVLYTLSGRADSARGWGRAGETWGFMEALADLGGPTWFNLGDRDLATHVLRSGMLGRGATLSEATAELARRMNLACRILPVSDDPVRTMIDTEEGWLEMQRYFVERRCEPKVRNIHYDGADTAVPSSAVIAALADPDLAGVIFCPSNPYLSIGPMLAVEGFRGLLAEIRAPRIAVSPLVAGRAIKGPLGKIMEELGHPPTPTSIFKCYQDLIDILVIDPADDPEDLPRDRVAFQSSMMKCDADKIALARSILDTIIGPRE